MPPSQVHTMKQTSAKLAKLASQVLKGYDPTRDEIESLAASVLVQREITRAEKKRIANENIAAEEAAKEAARHWGTVSQKTGSPTKPKTSWLSGLFGKK